MVAKECIRCHGISNEYTMCTRCNRVACSECLFLGELTRYYVVNDMAYCKSCYKSLKIYRGLYGKFVEIF